MPTTRSGTTRSDPANLASLPETVPITSANNPPISVPSTTREVINEFSHNNSFQSSSSRVERQNQEPGTTQEFESLITSIVNRVLEKQVANIIQKSLNPNSEQFAGEDQIILQEHRENLSDLDRIPEVVRCLREFSGDRREFISWKRSVDRIFETYEPIRGTAKYFGILSVIRNKIVGEADVALESYNTPLNWSCISKCLVMHYADKRDLGTLEYQLMSLVQGNNSIETFYQNIYSHLSLILNKIGCLDVGNESMSILKQTYRDKALDTFVRGLKGDLPRLLAIREPSDLPQALHLCLKLQNQNFRSHHANQNAINKSFNLSYSSPKLHHNNSSSPQTGRTSYPQQNFGSHGAIPRFQNQSFIPQNKTHYQNNNQQTFKPQYNNQQTFKPQYNFRSNNPFTAPIQPKLEPIDKGPSVQVKPHYHRGSTQFKQSQRSHRPVPHYNIEQELSKYNEAFESENTNGDETLESYEQADYFETPNVNETINFTDFHFFD